MSSAALNLSALPLEVFLMVAREIPYNERRAAMKNLCLVSKEFRTKAQPVLFEYIALDVMAIHDLLRKWKTAFPKMFGHTVALCLHMPYHKDSDKSGMIQSLKHIVAYFPKNKLQVLTFTHTSELEKDSYELIFRFIQSQKKLRRVYLPPLEPNSRNRNIVRISKDYKDTAPPDENVQGYWEGRDGAGNPKKRDLAFAGSSPVSITRHLLRNTAQITSICLFGGEQSPRQFPLAGRIFRMGSTLNIALTKLVLSHVRTVFPVGRPDFSNLEILEVFDCINCKDLFDMVKKDNPKLKSFRFQELFKGKQNSFTNARPLLEMIAAFPSLQNLLVIAPTITKSGNHHIMKAIGPEIRTASIWCGDGIDFSIDHLEHLIRKCPQLEALGCPMYFAGDIFRPSPLPSQMKENFASLSKTLQKSTGLKQIMGFVSPPRTYGRHAYIAEHHGANHYEPALAEWAKNIQAMKSNIEVISMAKIEDMLNGLQFPLEEPRHFSIEKSALVGTNDLPIQQQQIVKDLSPHTAFEVKDYANKIGSPLVLDNARVDPYLLSTQLSGGA